ncbi:AraC family transcriptional regulator [Undibacterium sp. TS12]|uniref:AraC family transcriptional regulator n=1 Tax=Undibacterium sp. TS12 TaxID=2908202 RepID=UPI001F4D1EE5|nr:AraC family transcriptional regulator [Undibacterium sp. TS12]MCH8619749.1 AraC family transcriptional regulator [Undibacterium sp. TS12]
MQNQYLSSPDSLPSPTPVLAGLVGNIIQADGDCTTQVPGLVMVRRSRVTDPMPCFYGLGLGVTVQGSKRVNLGDEVFDYVPGQSLVTSVDLPVVSYVTAASKVQPFLGMYLVLDALAITQCAANMSFTTPLKAASSLAMSVVTMEDGLLDAITRLVRLLDEPQMIPMLAPLIRQEITVRLLNGEHGPVLRHLVTAGSPGQQIARVIAWLKQNYTEDVAIDELASKAHMSASTFRLHFRTVAGMSPLQYLKHLRLQNARQIMLVEDIDASSAAIRVGYESASQFSREYTRLFGEPPLRDIRRMRQAM